MDKKLIDDIMIGSGISKYTINEDHSINIDGNVALNSEQLIIQYMINGSIKLNIINGDFSCMLKGDLSNASLPKIVYGDFDISFSDFKTLERCPEYVGGDYNCSYNELTTLKGCIKEVNGDFNCSMNELLTLEHAPYNVSGDVDISHNLLTNLKYTPIAESYFVIGNDFDDDITDDNIHQVIRNYKIVDILE